MEGILVIESVGWEFFLGQKQDLIPENSAVKDGINHRKGHNLNSFTTHNFLQSIPWNPLYRPYNLLDLENKCKTLELNVD